jgi:D-glycero-D-manno-heptose 1,7-bisphosphate phosphatase
MRWAVFLDRDGVLIEDVNLLTKREQIRILPSVPEALERLRRAGFALIVVSNQTVVARGLATEEDVRTIHVCLQYLLVEAGGPSLDGWYFCPHHPNATLIAYRKVCLCRKPGTGMFLQAAKELNLDLHKSFAIGDRLTDIIAGTAAGCRTILLRTGKHLEPPIETAQALDTSTQPNYTCDDLGSAASWILKTTDERR